MAIAEESEISWARFLRPSDRIACSQMTSEPQQLLRSLARTLAGESGTPMPRSLFLGTPFSSEAAAFPAEVALEVFGGMGAALAMSRQRPLTIYPVNYSRSATMFRDGDARAEVVLVSLARDPASGGLFLGASHGYAIEAARRARVVIAEINAQAPCVSGGEWPEDIAIDCSVEADYPIAESGPARAGETEERIAAQVAGLVPDGATIQVGIGSLAGALLQRLEGHRHLGIHSGLLTAPLWALVQSGAADNSRKAIERGISVCSALYGDAQMYRAVSGNDAVAMRPPDVSHGIGSLARLPAFTALNSALEIDLLGQANSEAAGNRYIGGVGGINDFVRGAGASRGGRSIVCLPSRRASRSGVAGSIVARLSGPATVGASDADVVVTEYGIAWLRGASRGERARRMIGIAHPEERVALEAAAREMHLFN
jgi:acyl-CoA hydrolase